jgi:hypothetical protein
MLEVLDSAEWVAEKSCHVEIDRDALRAFCAGLSKESLLVPPWDSRYHFSGGREETVAYLLVLDTLNFCFWPADGKERWEIQYGTERLSGYYGLAASLKKAVEAGVPITRPEYLGGLSIEDIQEILSGQGELLLMERRLEALRELGQVLRKDFSGSASLMVASAEGSAMRLARLLAEKLASFRDAAEYQGRKVSFYKRAQITAADLYGAFGGKGPGGFSDMAALTAFADYKLPQVLRHMGVLCYAPSLQEKVDQMINLEAGRQEEVEIRANTIWAVELIRQELKRRGKGLRAFEIDRVLWTLGQDDRFRKRPYHRTVTIFY